MVCFWRSMSAPCKSMILVSCSSVMSGRTLLLPRASYSILSALCFLRGRSPRAVQFYAVPGIFGYILPVRPSCRANRHEKAPLHIKQKALMTYFPLTNEIVLFILIIGGDLPSVIEMSSSTPNRAAMTGPVIFFISENFQQVISLFQYNINRFHVPHAKIVSSLLFLTLFYVN